MHDSGSPIPGFILVLGCLALYFLPTIVARTRLHHNAFAITILNLVGGWTVAGWIIALVWACTRVEPIPPPPHASVSAEAGTTQWDRIRQMREEIRATRNARHDDIYKPPPQLRG